MAIYSLGVRTTNVTVSNTNWTLIAAATDRGYIMELGVWMAAATASVLGFGRPAAVGITPTTPVTILAEDPAAPASTLTTALAWGTLPTAPTAFNRRINLPATIGAGVILTFPRGFIVPVSGNVTTYNITASGVMDLHVVCED
jgi:hypothetical protein